MLQNYTYILNYQKCAFTKIVANIRISRIEIRGDLQTVG